MKLTRITAVVLCSVLAAAGLILAARTLFGPFDVPFPVHSPLTAEGWFAVAVLLLVGVGRTSRSAAGLPAGSSGSTERPTRSPAAEQGVRPTILVILIAAIFAIFARAATSYFLSDDFLIVRYANEYHFSF